MPGTVSLNGNDNKVTLSSSEATEAVTYHVTVAKDGVNFPAEEYTVNVNAKVEIERTYEAGNYTVRIESRAGNYKYRADFTIPTTPPVTISASSESEQAMPVG